MTIESPYGDHLPIFPYLGYAPVSESRIERVVESLFNCADNALMTGKATQEQYDAWSKQLNKWADEQYGKCR